MARRPQTSPRKTASQNRSRLTVDALVEATARVLTKEGYDRASTNKIAAVAGVSIGSLYQYFPSKEALVAAVIDRHTQKLSQVARAALLKVAASPIEIAVRELVAAAIDAHRVDPKLHRVLAEEVPRTGRLENIEAVERNACAFVRGYLEAHRSEIDAPRSRPRCFHRGDDGGGADAFRSPAPPGHPRGRKGRRVCGRCDATCAPVSANAIAAPPGHARGCSKNPTTRRWCTVPTLTHDAIERAH